MGFDIFTADRHDNDQLPGGKWEKKILMGHECKSFSHTDNGIMVRTSFHKEGKLVERYIRCSILIGADGAGSTVRKLVGIDMKGERNMQNLVSVHFLSRDLGNYLLHERPGMLFFIFNPDAIGVLVAHDLNEGEFVLQVIYFDFSVLEFIWLLLSLTSPVISCTLPTHPIKMHFHIFRVSLIPLFTDSILSSSTKLGRIHS